MAMTQLPSAGEDVASLARAALDRAVRLLLADQHENGSWAADGCEPGHAESPGAVARASSPGAGAEAGSERQFPMVWMAHSPHSIGVDVPSTPIASAASVTITAVTQDLLLREVLGIRTRARTEAAARQIRAMQQPDGSWTEPGSGEMDLGGAIQAYVVLRLAGEPADSYHMALAAGRIRDSGGLAGADTVTKVWLALAGMSEWNCLPVIPPEVVFLHRLGHKWLDYSAIVARHMGGAGDATSAFDVMIPLAILESVRPLVPPQPFNLSELESPWTVPQASEPAREHRAEDPRGGGSTPGRVARRTAGAPPRALRAAARRRCADWMLVHQEPDGSWSRAALPTSFALIALSQLGYPRKHPALALGLAWLDQRATWVSGSADRAARDTARADRGVSDVPPADPAVANTACMLRDTALAAAALAAAGLAPDHPALTRAAAFLSRPAGPAAADLGSRARRPGTGRPDTGRTSAAVTADAVAALGAAGLAASKRARSGVVRLLRAQHEDGSWSDTSNSGPIPVTATVLRSLIAAGVQPGKPAIRRGTRWLAAAQGKDGGWPASPGPAAAPDPIATALAVQALLAARGSETLGALSGGIRWLASHQRPDGSWGQPPSPGPRFGGSFLDGPVLAGKFEAADCPGPHLFRICCPMHALSSYLRQVATGQAIGRERGSAA